MQSKSCSRPLARAGQPQVARALVFMVLSVPGFAMRPLMLHAQAIAGTILAGVRGRSSTVIPDSTTSVSSHCASIPQAGQAGENEQYSVPYVVPGLDTAGDKHGFEKATLSGVDLLVDEKARVAFTFRTRNVSESRAGEARPAKIETEDKAQAINSKELADLVLTPRYVAGTIAPLVSLSTGSMSSAGQDASVGVSNSQGLSSLSADRTSSDGINSQIEGVSNNPTLTKDVDTRLSIDARPELNVSIRSSLAACPQHGQIQKLQFRANPTQIRYAA